MTDLITATHSSIRRSAADTFCSAVQVASHLNDVKQFFSRYVLFQMPMERSKETIKRRKARGEKQKKPNHSKIKKENK